MQKTEQKHFFTRVDSLSSAIQIIRFTSNILFFVAAMQLITALFVFSNFRSPATFFDCITGGACALGIRRLHSRIASLIALTLASANLIYVISHPASFSIIFAFVTVWAAVRALEATIKLHGRLAATPVNSFSFKNLGIAFAAISSTLIVLYFFITFPPSRAEEKMLRHMQADMRAILNRENVKILKQGGIAKFGLVSLGATVSQEGWGTVLKPGTEDILSGRRWKKYSENNDIFCKDGVQLNFTPVMEQGKGAVSINIFYNNLSKKNCRLLEGG